MTEPSAYLRWRDAPTNKTCFGEWYQAVYPTLLEAAFRVTRGDRFLAEDVVQDAIVRFATKHVHRRIESEAGATAYLVRSVYNGWIDHIRKHRKERPTEAVPDVADETTPVDIIAAEEKAKAISNTLKAEDQVILAMMMAGEPLSAIAELMGIAYPTAGVRVHRIRQLIKDL